MGYIVSYEYSKAHPALPVILSKLFRLIVLSRHVPTTFGYSYIVPISKSSVGFSKPLNCEDFRGIAISPIISKVFEYCFLHKLGDFLSSKANQGRFDIQRKIRQTECWKQI